MSWFATANDFVGGSASEAWFCGSIGSAKVVRSDGTRSRHRRLLRFSGPGSRVSLALICCGLASLTASGCMLASSSLGFVIGTRDVHQHSARQPFLGLRQGGLGSPSHQLLWMRDGKRHRVVVGSTATDYDTEISEQVLDALKEFDGDFRAPYRLLGITDPECEQAEIRAAFRRVAKVEHPDVSDRPDADERFERISMAYALLMDDGGRAMLMEAMERKVEELEELETTQTVLDESNEAWEARWADDEFVQVYRTAFLIVLFSVMGYTFWWWGFEHD